MVAVSPITSMAVSLLPKSAGSIARIGDDRYAPKEVRRATMAREATTLAQVGIYTAVIERGFNVLKNKAHLMVERGEKNFFTEATLGLEKHSLLFLAGMLFTSNISAEMISRKLSPRNVWQKPDDKSGNKLAGKSAAIQPPIKATLVDEAKGREIPVEIEICEVMPAAKRAKGNPRFEAAPKGQPVPFTSRAVLPAFGPAAVPTARTTPGPNAPVNPFQLKTPLNSVSPAISSSVARPSFSV